MKKIILLLILSNFTYATPKLISASLHGEKMSVSYSMLDNGSKILEVKEIIGRKKNKALFESKQKINLKLSPDDEVSSIVGVMCFLEKTLVYAVFSKSKAREKCIFPAKKAWIIDQKNIKLTAIKDIKKVSCSWHPEGESTFPF